jgi:hypothetical protein
MPKTSLVFGVRLGAEAGSGGRGKPKLDSMTKHNARSFRSLPYKRVGRITPREPRRRLLCRAQQA